MRLMLLFALVMITSCTTWDKNDMLILGNEKSDKAFVYLHGLDQDSPSEQELNNRQILNRIGKELDVKFLAIRAIDHCPQFDNKLCWPQKTIEDLHGVKTRLDDVTQTYNIKGYVGFSNGGFYLNEAAQQGLLPSDTNIVSVGAGGTYNADNANKVPRTFIIIGKNDTYQYKPSINLSKSLPNSVLFEFQGAHEMPYLELYKAVKQILRN